MKLLHVVPTYAPAWRYGGPIRAVHELCRHLVERGHAVEVITTSADGPGDLDVPEGRPVDLDGVRVRYFRCGWPRRLYRAPSMRPALREAVARADVVHLHSVFLWPTYAAARAASRAGVPYIVSPRGMLVPDLIRRRSFLAKSAWIRLVERATLERAWGLHATSQLELDEAARLDLRWPHRFVVPNGVQPEPFDGRWETVSPPVRKLHDADPREPVVLYLGRLSWKKGLGPLVQAIAGVPRARLVIAGPDDEGLTDGLHALALRQGAAERVTFTGPVQGRDKAALLQLAQVVVLPSRSENFGNVVLEAMAAARPVVVTPGVGAAAIVREAGAGLVVDGEPAALAEALRELLADKGLRTRLGRCGREAALRDFSWRAVAAALEARYRAASAMAGASAGGVRVCDSVVGRLPVPGAR